MDSENSNFGLGGFLIVKIPPKRVREEFALACKLRGYQRGIDLLSAYYCVKKMKVVLDGRRVGNGDLACYHRNKAYFSRKGLNESNLLHEFCHFLLEKKSFEMPVGTEEREANNYAREFLRKTNLR